MRIVNCRGLETLKNKPRLRLPESIPTIAMKDRGTLMRSVNVAELKNRLSKYLTFAKGGEEIIIRDRNLPVAKLVPFFPDQGTEEELLLVAAGKMRLPESPVDLEKVLQISTGKHVGRAGTQALLEDREQSDPGWERSQRRTRR